MTVYVDDWRQEATVGPVTARWSHLTADTTGELHVFAAALGMRRAWFQAHPHDPLRHHYDVTDRLRDEAIARGAVQVTWRQAARRRRERRRQGPDRSEPGSTLGSMTPADANPSAHHQIAAALLVLGAATLGESGGRTMLPRVRAVWKGATISAPGYPVRCSPGDNLAIHVAVAKAPPGHVLVVDVGDQEGFGYWGEVLTTGAQARGLAGLVIDGGVRDVAALESHRFAAFSTTVALRGAAKQAPGSVGTPAPVGGVEVHTGDWVVADADGVAVIPADAIDAVLAAGRIRAEKEEGFFAALADGATTVELLSLDISPIEVG